MKGCTEEKEPSWRGDCLACWPDALSTQPAILPSLTLPCLHCFTLNLTNAYSLTHVGWKWLGFALEWTCKIKLWFLDCLKRMWSFFVGQALESCKEGIQCRVSLFAYFTWRQSSDDLRSPLGDRWIAPHCPQMFVVATVCTQGRRMLWPFDCVAVLLSPSLLHFEITRFLRIKTLIKYAFFEMDRRLWLKNWSSCID